MQRIQLTQNQFALVDDEDFERINSLKWYASKQGTHEKFYAVRCTDKKRKGFPREYKKFWMHREIMNCPAGMYVDHINGDGLDNRKENLRIVTWDENSRFALAKGWETRYRPKDAICL